MRTVKIQIYTFSELSGDAQSKVIETFRDINVNFEWWDFVYSDAENIGIKITSFDLDRNKHANGEFISSAVEVAANIIKEHGPECATYKTAQAFLGEHGPIFADYTNEDSEGHESAENEEKLQDLEEEFLNSLLEDYAQILQNEYEYLCSDESIKETIEANGYEFTESGEIF